MTKQEMAITILQALWYKTEDVVKYIIEFHPNHGDYRGILKQKKSRVEEQYALAQRVLKNRGANNVR